MPDVRRRRCMVCGRPDSEVGSLSWTGKCVECGHRLRNQHNDALHYHRGPEMLEWRRKVAHSVGAVLLDDIEGRT